MFVNIYNDRAHFCILQCKLRFIFACDFISFSFTYVTMTLIDYYSEKHKRRNCICEL